MLPYLFILKKSIRKYVYVFKSVFISSNLSLEQVEQYLLNMIKYNEFKVKTKKNKTNYDFLPYTDIKWLFNLVHQQPTDPALHSEYYSPQV